MLNLIKNELIKIFKRKHIYILLFILFLYQVQLYQKNTVKVQSKIC